MFPKALSLLPLCVALWVPAPVLAQNPTPSQPLAPALAPASASAGECAPSTAQAACVGDMVLAFQQAHPQRVQRTPEHLVVALDNGRIRLLADVEQRLEAVALAPLARFVTLRERHSGGYRWHVVSLQTGALTRVEGYPVFSPDAAHFLALQDVTVAPPSPGVARLFKAQHPVPELLWRATCEDDVLWGARQAQWRDAQSLVFVQTRWEDPSRSQAQDKGQVVLALTGKKWAATGLTCTPAKRR